MKRRRHAGLLAMALLSTATATAGADAPIAADVARLARPLIDEGRVVGLVVGVLRGGDSEVFGFGRPSLEDKQPPDGRTIFEIGSITKVFTSIALATMVEDGLVRLDQPVSECLPAGVRVPSRNGRAITLADLATHRSGLPRVLPKMLVGAFSGKTPYEDVKPDDVFRFLEGFELKTEPGSRYAYSNLGGGLLGMALAHRAGTSYEDLIVSRISTPLGLRDTAIRLDDAQRLRLAKPYTSKGKLTSPWTFDALAGAGALRSTADDLLLFARANLDPRRASGSLRKALDEARKPRADADRKGVKQGLGWIISEARPESKHPAITWHNGGTGGFRSFLGLAQKEKLAVVVLGNSDAPLDDLGFSILDRLTSR